MAIHARPRFTDDLEIWIESEESNARNLLNALSDFGFGGMDITIDDLLKEEQVIQLGYAPLRIDLLTSVSNVRFEEAWERKVTSSYGDHTVYYIGKADLVASKRGTGRKRDQLDLDELERGQKPGK